MNDGKKRNQALRVLLIGLLLLLLKGQVSADHRFYAVSDLKPGMTGEGYTVLSGTKVESFPVEVVGLLKGSGSVSHLILIKLTGTKVPGIASGMSGSPIFIDQKLIGAIGYGFQNTDARYAMVTPIEEMLALWEAPVETGEQFIFYQGGLPGVQGVAFGRAPSDYWLIAQPVQTPLLLSGYGPRARDYLSATFARRGYLTPVASQHQTTPGQPGALLPLGAAADKLRAPFPVETLQPGSAITALLVDGDYQIAAVGTLTWLEKEKFLAFGHPFLNKGPVDYGVGGASIVEIIESNVFPFKLGIALPGFGRVTQDRGAGIAGEIGVFPQMVKVTTEVTDLSTHCTKTYEFNVFHDESFLPELVLAGVMDATDRTLDRIGAGTAKVTFQIDGPNLPPIKRENLFYGQDVAAAALREVGRVLRAITDNEFVEPQITEISTRITVNPERLSANLIDVELPKKEFAPGEKVTILGKLLPYRGTETEIPLEIELPTTPGKWLLFVYGSDFGLMYEETQEDIEEQGYDGEYYKTYTSLDDVLQDYLKRPQNNQLVAEVLPAERMEAPMTEEEDDWAQADDRNKEKHYWTVDTPYYLTGEKQILIEVVEPVIEEEDQSSNYQPPEEEESASSGTKF